jgi:HEAT repeat protein
MSAKPATTAAQPALPTDKAVEPEASASRPSQRPSSSAAAVVNEIVAGTGPRGVDHYVRALADEKESVSSQAARVIEEVGSVKPALLAPHLERLIGALSSEHTRVAQAAAQALPQLARVAPAKVARHLPTLQAALQAPSPIAQDGLVHTLVALCLASVTYQRRLIESFERALREADDKALPRWAEAILPALKGEPYAQVRAVVERRLGDPQLPRPVAQRVADVLGIKLRPALR